MKSFDWADLLRHHPIFSSLRDDKRVRWLLADDVSTERAYAPEAVIIREGEVGDSVFLIGSGSVDVWLAGEGTQKVPLATLRRGEIFGEMSFFERRQRSATVEAREPCTVLEVRSSAFGDLIADYPDIEFKVLLKLSERLRNTDAQVAAAQLRNVDEKLKRFEERLDIQQKMVDTSLKSAVAVFDQTKLRADEVINAAERSRTRVTATTSALVGILTLVAALLGGLGFWELLKVQKAAESIDLAKKSAEQAAKNAGEAANTAQKDSGLIDELKGKAAQIQQTLVESSRTLDETRKLVTSDLRRRFEHALNGYHQGDAFEVYARLRQFNPEDQELADGLLDAIEGHILREERRNWDQLLRDIMGREKLAGMPRAEILAGHLLLANAILTAPERFEQTLTEFAEVVRRNKKLATEVATKDLRVGRIKQFLEDQQDRQEMVRRAAPIISAR